MNNNDNFKNKQVSVTFLRTYRQKYNKASQ